MHGEINIGGAKDIIGKVSSAFQKKINDPLKKNPPEKHYKLPTATVTAEGPSANERLVNAVEDRVGTEEWRTPNEQTTRFPKIRKGINKVKAALGKEGYNEKGQTMGDTCVSFVRGACQKANVDFLDTWNTRDFVKDKQDKGIKGHGRFKRQPGDIVVFSRKDQNSKTNPDWTGEGPRPTHIGVVSSNKDDYTGSSSGNVESKGIFRKDTKGYKIRFYTPQNKYE